MKTKGYKQMHTFPVMPKRLTTRNGYRTMNYFYRMFDHIGAQFAAVNQGLKDSGPTRAWQLK